MEKQIVIKDIIFAPSAFAESQALLVREKINYKEKKIILDFTGITEVTTAFLNILLDGFIGIVKKPEEVLDILKFENHSPLLVYAFKDAYGLFEDRF